jgi:hypothetical protein
MMGAAHDRTPAYRDNTPLDGAVVRQWFCDLVREVVEQHLQFQVLEAAEASKLIAGLVSVLSGGRNMRILARCRVRVVVEAEDHG